MGNWTVVIEGTGQHHNNDQEADAERLVEAFIMKLKKHGHKIDHASFTASGRTLYDLGDPANDMGSD